MKVKTGGTSPTEVAAATPPPVDAAEALVKANEKLKKFFDAITNTTENFPIDDLVINLETSYSSLNERIITTEKQNAIQEYLKTPNNILEQYKKLLQTILPDSS